ncbi:hypothetical protein [Oricola indica]|uniref:hypothetical protein n=1 Tax=Oricola indica TaxID=2872591 RepID=UPI003CCC1F67
MGKVNAEWHNANPIPKNPTLTQRIAWHRAHAAHCACREMPANIRKLVEEEDARESKAEKTGQ